MQRNHGECSLALSFGEMPLDRFVVDFAFHNFTHDISTRIDFGFSRARLVSFAGKGCFHMSIQAVATSQWSSGKYLRVSQKPFLGFQNELSLSGLAVRSCPVVGRRRVFRQCPGVDRRRAVRSCPVVESCRTIKPCPVVRGRRAVRYCPSVNPGFFIPQPSESVSSSLNLRFPFIYIFKEPSPVQSWRAVRSYPVVGSCSVEPHVNQSVSAVLSYVLHLFSNSRSLPPSIRFGLSDPALSSGPVLSSPMLIKVSDPVLF